MIEIEEGLRSFLVSSVPLLDGGVYLQAIPDGARMPVLTYARISTPKRVMAHDGSIGLVTATFQLDCWDESFDGAREVATDVRQALDGYRGAMGSTVDVDSVFIRADRQDFNPENSLQRVILEAVVMYHEEV